MQQRYALLDIDNCIADDSWRIPRIDWRARSRFERYHTYHQLSPWDLCTNAELFTGREERIVILTCRPVHYRALTVEWLSRNNVRYDHLLMRNSEDHRPSTAVKQSFVQDLWHYGIQVAQIAIAYDDRQEVVEMYGKEFGIQAERRCIHNISAYHNPVEKVNHADGSKL